MNISPPILENFIHEHEDPYTQWRLATYSDGSPLLVCIQGTADVTKEHHQWAVYTQEEVIHRNKFPGATEYTGPYARDHHHRHLPLGYKFFQV